MRTYTAPMSQRSLRRFFNSAIARRSVHNTTHTAGPFWQKPQFSTAAKMSSIGGAGIGAGLYAAVSNPGQIAAQPEEAAAKAHHLKNGKGFTNPWESYSELSALQIFWGILSYVSLSAMLRALANDWTAVRSRARRINQILHPRLSPSAHLPSSPPARHPSSALHGSATRATTSSSPVACACSSTRCLRTAARPST